MFMTRNLWTIQNKPNILIMQYTIYVYVRVIHTFTLHTTVGVLIVNLRPIHSLTLMSELGDDVKINLN